jgi:hypothetical protein
MERGRCLAIRGCICMVRIFVGRRSTQATPCIPTFRHSRTGEATEGAGMTWHARQAWQGRPPRPHEEVGLEKGQSGAGWISAVKLTPRSPRKASLPIDPLATLWLHAYGLKHPGARSKHPDDALSYLLCNIHQRRVSQVRPPQKDGIPGVDEATPPDGIDR